MKNLILIFFVSLFAISVTNVQAQSKQKIEKEVEGVVQTWFKNFNSHDLDALVDMYDEQGIIGPSGFPLQIGKEKIRQTFTEMFKLDPHLDHKIAKITIEGKNLGIVLGEYNFKINTMKEGETQVGRFLVVYKKYDDGQWRLLYDIDNIAPDVIPSQW